MLRQLLFGGRTCAQHHLHHLPIREALVRIEQVNHLHVASFVLVQKDRLQNLLLGIRIENVKLAVVLGLPWSQGHDKITMVICGTMHSEAIKLAAPEFADANLQNLSPAQVPLLDGGQIWNLADQSPVRRLSQFKLTAASHDVLNVPVAVHFDANDDTAIPKTHM